MKKKIKTSKRIILDLDFKLHQNMIDYRNYCIFRRFKKRRNDNIKKKENQSTKSITVNFLMK